MSVITRGQYAEPAFPAVAVLTAVGARDAASTGIVDEVALSEFSSQTRRRPKPNVGDRSVHQSALRSAAGVGAVFVGLTEGPFTPLSPASGCSSCAMTKPYPSRWRQGERRWSSPLGRMSERLEVVSLMSSRRVRRRWRQAAAQFVDAPELFVAQHHGASSEDFLRVGDREGAGAAVSIMRSRLLGRDRPCASSRCAMVTMTGHRAAVA